MKYEIVEAAGVHQLEEMVNEMLEVGWELQGGYARLNMAEILITRKL